jgi:uncharacterized protein
MKKDQMYNSLKRELDKNTAWPMLYMFKFIVPKSKQNQVTTMFKTHELQSKESKNGNYVSLTAQMFMNSSQDVINVYKKASTIEGLIAL